MSTSHQSDHHGIEAHLREHRQFQPPEEFSRKAAIRNMDQYRAMYQRSIDDPEGFFAEQAEKELEWFEKWHTVLDWQPPTARWFDGGKLNISHNCLDRHARGPLRNKAAIIFEGEPGDIRTLTYGQLLYEVQKFANVLRDLGVTAGDRVAIYMPMIPEAMFAMLACARIGAVHSVIFGGFSAEALKDRLNDAQAKVVVTADGGWRRGKIVPLKQNVDAALRGAPSVKDVVIVRRTAQHIEFEYGRDHWWHELRENASASCPAIPLDSEHPLFILYTSGTTGKPKGILHTTGGYLLGAHLTSKYVFDLREEDTYWCTADIGWITGHTYVTFGPLSNGATVFIYEGAPDTPQYDRFWRMIDRHQVTVFYTAPTAIRQFIKWGEQWPRRCSLRSLRLLGSVGEPINPEAWMWYHKVIGHGNSPIVDTWWQTETGSIMITPMPGATPTKPGTATLPFFGIEPDVVNKAGESQPANAGGYLVIRKPWPSMMRTIYGDPERFKKTYFSDFPDGIYFTGDGARRDEDGYFWIMGRVDDVINVSGHRLGTMEVESALVSHPLVAEAAVVGKPHEIKGQGICAFVTLAAGNEPTDSLREELRQHVAKEIGALARPDEIRFTDSLPKTRSGKIMRRLLRDIAAGQESVGDTSTLEDYSVLAKLRETDE
jgi:acetyl-CoA synthetase